MKTVFGLLLLSGVLAVQGFGIYVEPEVPCRLLVNNSLGGPSVSSIGQMTSGALNALLGFLGSRNLDFTSVVCVTEQPVEGYSYGVQYNGYNWVQIYSSTFGEVQIIGEGVLPEREEHPV